VLDGISGDSFVELIAGTKPSVFTMYEGRQGWLRTARA
jgi:hypothetical protein